MPFVPRIYGPLVLLGCGGVVATPFPMRDIAATAHDDPLMQLAFVSVHPTFVSSRRHGYSAADQLFRLF